MPRRTFVRLLCSVLLMGAAHAAPQVTFESLLSEMTNLEALTRFPDPAYTCKQFSSYDRRSTDPNELTDENWFANGDRGRHLRTEERNGETEWVMMDAAGPGAIVRMWSANPKDAGVLRIFLDGAEEPVIEMPLTEFLGGEHMPTINPIGGVQGLGWNSYLPIPYAKHCKVTCSQGDFYYHVNYRTYAPGTQVASYTSAAAQRAQQAIQDVAKRLSTPASFGPVPSTWFVELDEALAPGASASTEFEGPAALYRLAMNVEADDMPAALRGCLIEIFFDGGTTPAVQAPLGDFFGTAPGANAYLSLPSGVTSTGQMYSHWVMPFERSARMTLTNHTQSDIAVTGQAVAGPYEWSDRSMYFHAKWRTENPIATRPRQDWNYLDCTGTGVFVGVMCHVTNPVKQWWGEGDEKIYVDGEAFPSHFGTGTEDYFGYAWCCPETFTHAYHNQPRCDGPGNYGQTCVSRFHIIDNIPFTQSFKFDMEVWHWTECEIGMAVIAYWYAKPGGTDTFSAPAPGQLIVVDAPPMPEPKRVEGALEGEDFEVVSSTGGNARDQEGAWGWSGERQFWWTHAKTGDKTVLAFPVKTAGRYQVLGRFTKAPDYAIAQLHVNGAPAGAPLDFFHPGVIATPEIPLGVFDLTEGDNTLTITLTGRNAKAIDGMMFGLDYLRLEPAP
ncbi:MAG: DUF2961 domain-containing protein [Nitrospiraceae bacterium]|nr:DUF2961 domain-containing protein [Nitrospiraceae bacterium]